MDFYKFNPNFRMDNLVYMARIWEVRQWEIKIYLKNLKFNLENLNLFDSELIFHYTIELFTFKFLLKFFFKLRIENEVIKFFIF